MRRREFTTAGVAAGVAAGFNAPIGGLMFAMEDLSSFWTKSLTWLVFTCCIVSIVVSNLFNAAFGGFTRTATFGLLADYVSRPFCSVNVLVISRDSSRASRGVDLFAPKERNVHADTRRTRDSSTSIRSSPVNSRKSETDRDVHYCPVNAVDGESPVHGAEPM